MSPDPFSTRIFGINKRLRYLIILTVLVGAPAMAVPVTDLYTAKILVPTDGHSSLAQNAKAGLLQVLVRVSGSTDVDQNPTIAAALSHPSDYYYQYGYDAAAATGPPAADGQPVPARVLKIAFEPNAIARLLHDSGFPVWGSNRPSVLVWIAVNDAEGRHILTADDQSSILPAVEADAKDRGLPLLFPLLDIQDTSAISTAQVWGLFVDQIDAASARYNPDVVLAARIQQDTGGQWTGSWSFRLSNQWQESSDSEATASELITNMINSLANQLAQRYAVGSSKGSLLLKVDGINNLADYAAITAYLQSLTPVVNLSVVDVNGSKILFRISSDGNSTQLMQIISLDQKMTPLSPGTGTSVGNNTLQYHWVGN